MKINSRIGDGFFIGYVVMAILTLFFFVTWAVTGMWIPAIIFAIVLLFVLTPMYFGTNYEISPDGLKINCGLFCIGKTIPYRFIVSMTDVENIVPAPALSYKRIRVKYLKGEKLCSVYVSPSNKKLFRELVQVQIKTSDLLTKQAPAPIDKKVEEARSFALKEEEAIAKAPTKAEQKLLAKEQRLAEKERELLAAREEKERIAKEKASMQAREKEAAAQAAQAESMPQAPEETAEAVDVSAPANTADAPAKKGRGRPKGTVKATQTAPTAQSANSTKGRGRPAKSAEKVVTTEPTSSEAPSATKGRGRPKGSVKAKPAEAETAQKASEAPQPKAGRGRPKGSTKPKTQSASPAQEATDSTAKPKAGRGRPKGSTKAK